MLQNKSRKIKKSKQANSQKEENSSEESDMGTEANLTQKEIQYLKTHQHTEQDLICGICLNYIAMAVSTKCGHNFCELCLNEYLLVVKDCPHCSTKLRNAKSSQCTLLDEIITQHIQQQYPEEFQFYQDRIKETKDWRVKKQITNFQVGTKLDVRDPNYVWKIGVIKRQKLANDQRSHCLVIHYEGWPERFDEEILETSPRFAPLGFYTSRDDIPKYEMEQKNIFLKRKLFIKSYEDQIQQKDIKLYINYSSDE